MDVSKVLKQYLLSIDDELIESFESGVDNIERLIGGESSTLSQSGFQVYEKVIDSGLNMFYDNLFELVDYYSDGIYNSGKLQVRKELNLPIEKQKGKKYVFTEIDENHLYDYKDKRLIYFINKAKTNTKEYIYSMKHDDIINVIYSSYNDIFKLLIDELVDIFEKAKSSEYEQVGRNNCEE